MLRTADGWRALRWAADAARIGGACLAVAIVAFSPAPEIVLALLGVALLVVGGTAWSVAGTMAFRLAGPLLTVIAVRLLGGTVAAAFAAVLVALGGCLRVGLAEATVGLAVFAGAVVFLGGASVRLVATFWLLGAGVLAARWMGVSAWRRIRGGSPRAERATGVLLPPEN